MVEARLVGVEALAPQHPTAEDLFAMGGVRRRGAWFVSGTAAATAPALMLYESLGFARVRERTVARGRAYVEFCLAGQP